MEPILDNTEKLENSVDITAVQEYYNELKKSRIESEIAAAIDNGNCEKLYEYAVEKKTLIDPGQARIATKYLEIYTNNDSCVNKYKNNKMDASVRLITESTQDNVFFRS